LPQAFPGSMSLFQANATYKYSAE